MSESKNVEVEAIVTDIVGDKYAVAYEKSSDPASSDGITFSVSAWCDDWPPEKTQVVILSGVRKFARGWRARCARPIHYSIKQQ